MHFWSGALYFGFLSNEQGLKIIQFEVQSILQLIRSFFVFRIAHRIGFSKRMVDMFEKQGIPLNSTFYINVYVVVFDIFAEGQRMCKE